MGLERAQTRGTEYYRELRFHVYASPTGGDEMELVEGGDTDWTQKLLNNAKEHLITSGIGSERLCEKFVPIRQSLRASGNRKFGPIDQIETVHSSPAEITMCIPDLCADPCGIALDEVTGELEEYTGKCCDWKYTKVRQDEVEILGDTNRHNFS